MATMTEQRSTVVGVFEDRHQADAVVNELRKAGFREDQIGVAVRREEGETEATTAEKGTHWETGAATGALAGAGVGGLIGLGIMAGVIPVIGPVIAGGTLAAILANAAGGAALGGVVGALVEAGIPEEEARHYQSEFEAGRILVTVKADDRYDEAETILRRHSAHDVHAVVPRATTTAARVQAAAPQDRATCAKAITHEQIADRAHKIWQQHGYPPDTDLENWLEAERQLRCSEA